MLAVASDTANPQVVRLLLQRGSDPAAKSTVGETALDWAKKFNHPEIVRMLGGDVWKTKLVLKSTAHANTDLRKIIERSLPLLESTSVEYFKQSGCVGCHHQDVIGGALSAAARRGLRINDSSLQEQMRIVKFEMLGSREALLQSVFISVDGFAYALSMLADQDYPADEITDGIVSMIAAQQTVEGGWNEFPFVRPPLEASPFVVAALAVRGMARYAIPARKAEFEERLGRARRWLTASRTYAAYEEYFRVMGLKWSKADPRTMANALAEVRRLQRSDGGFPQSVNLASDAFATGAALSAMREAGVSSRDSAYQRAVQFLIATQQEDGSWYVASRSPKVQPYFQSGFPHNHDQWISSAATALAIKALAESVEPAALAAR